MIEAKVKLLLQMSLVLIWGMFSCSYSEVGTGTHVFLGANMPVVRIARIAGQFAK
jgi:3-deoxy-7-phosphoheptulonate synthase